MDLRAVIGAVGSDAGVAHGARLLAFADAVMSDDALRLGRERTALRAVLSPAEFVDTCAVIAAFNVVDRIADATGIPLDTAMLEMSAEVRREIDLSHFPSAANTPTRAPG